MFIHRAYIPVDFALSINFILHNTSCAKDWETIDAYILEKDLPSILQWIKYILEDNNIKRIPEEIKWWRKEIMKSENSYKFSVSKSEGKK